jgi:hypothetical protein
MGAQIALAYTGTSYVLIATTLSDAGEVFQGLGGSWSFLDVAWGGELSVEGVAASGDTVAVGSTYFNSSRGRVDVFTVSAGGLAQQATLFASDAAPGDRFGASMALDGDRLLVGAPLNGDMFGPDIGAAYVFERNGTAWSERKLLGPSDPGPSDHFGAAVAFDGATFVIGSPYDTHASGMTAGSAYVERIGFPSVSYCTAGVSTGNCVATMSSTGAPSASLATPFSIQASNVDGQRQGLIFYGTSGTYSSPWGSGSLCINQPLQRSAPQDSGGSSGACDGSLVLDWNAFVAANPGALGQPFAAGAQVWSQAWYRDPASVKTTQLSDALSFVVQP